jgi:hypothetical protein
VDLLYATRIHNLPLGVNRTTGMCTSRPGSEPDVAYSISERTILTVQTAQLFPLGYPMNFSLLLVVSPTKGKTLHVIKLKLLVTVNSLRCLFRPNFEMLVLILNKTISDIQIQLEEPAGKCSFL